MLARLVALSLTTQRTAARDATRRDALGAYGTALEQYYAQTHSYMVVPAGCTIKTGGATGNDTYPGNASAALPEGTPLTKCVGFDGAGWGSINRHKNSNITNYGTSAISEELRNEGFIQTISFDPRTGGSFPSQTATTVITSPSSVANFDDYILTLCDSAGNPAADAASATQYGLYAEFETASGAAAPSGTHASTSCGGPSTTSGGWNTIQ